MDIKVEIVNKESNSITEILGLDKETPNVFIKEVMLSETKGLIQSIMTTLEDYSPEKAGAVLVSMTAYKLNDIMAEFEKKVKKGK